MIASPDAIAIGRRALAEAMGTAALVAIVVGSGIQATSLSSDVGVQLLAVTLATVFGLAVLITMLGPVSGAHLNPVISAADWWNGRHDSTGLTSRQLVAYIPAQTIGAIGGAVLANAMFAAPLVKWSTHHRSAGHLWLGEAVATAGLTVVVFGLARSSRSHLSALAVAAWIGAAYWFTSSTSFANPAVTVGRAFTDTFAGIAPASVPDFIAAQLAGGVVGLALVSLLFTDPKGKTSVSKPAPPEVLFVCVHNAGRSQMAAALLDHHAKGSVVVRSAGSAPADEINPAVVAALAEIGVDVGKEFPKKLTDEAVEASDVVISMGCGDACPVFPGKRYLVWDLPDPAGRGVEDVRPIRDQIDGLVRGLLSELVAE